MAEIFTKKHLLYGGAALLIVGAVVAATYDSSSANGSVGTGQPEDVQRRRALMSLCYNPLNLTFVNQNTLIEQVFMPMWQAVDGYDRMGPVKRDEAASAIANAVVGGQGKCRHPTDAILTANDLARVAWERLTGTGA